MDTEGNFRHERIESIAGRFGLDSDETLDNIIVARAFNHEQQIDRAQVWHTRCECSPLRHREGELVGMIHLKVLSRWATRLYYTSGKGNIMKSSKYATQQQNGCHCWSWKN